MNQDEIKAYLAWLDDKFGLDFKDDEIGSKAYLWGKPVAMWESGTIYKCAGHFQHTTVLLWREWRAYND